MKAITLGDVTVTRIQESEGFFPIAALLASEGGREDWEENSSSLVPNHWDPESNEIQVSVASYLLRSAGKNILIDTGSGNGKERPYFPPAAHLDTDYLKNLAQEGLSPEDVDIVVCTHLHMDHVGWNTVLENREWIPTFPNAVYFFTHEDFEFWNPLNEKKPRGALINQNAYEDSIAPIHNAGKVKLWSDSLTLDENITLLAAPGHTPGSAVLNVTSGSDRAIFAGDIMHHPMQIMQPHWNSCFDENPEESRTTRREILSRAADTNTLIFAAHFAGGQVAEVEKNGDTFRIKAWV